MNAAINVAVGVLQNANNLYLLTKRKKGTHCAGLWEFPGGKVEPNESIERALVREFKEEVAIEVLSAKFLEKFPYCYEDKQVILNVYLITEYSGDAFGCEGQSVAWYSLHEIYRLPLPAANHPILAVLTKIHNNKDRN